MSTVANITFRTLEDAVESGTPSTLFLGSPDLIKNANGDLLMSYDEFGSGASTNGSGYYDQWRIARRPNASTTWTADYANKTGLYFARFLRVEDTEDLFLLGVSAQRGDVVICKSTDHGATWAAPVTLKSNLGGIGYTTAPVPVAVDRGEFVVAIEYSNASLYAPQEVMIGRCSVTADPTVSGNWTWGSHYTRVLADYPLGGSTAWGVLEGNMLMNGEQLEYWGRISPDSGANHGTKILRADVIGTELSNVRYETFYGGHSKFWIQADPDGFGFWAACNNMPTVDGEDRRTHLFLHWANSLETLSRDFDSTAVCKLVESSNGQYANQGFQYPSLLFDGDDLLVAIRTGWNGANSYHNSNRLQVATVSNYRDLIPLS